jgi:hypothetical protein
MHLLILAGKSKYSRAVYEYAIEFMVFFLSVSDILIMIVVICNLWNIRNVYKLNNRRLLVYKFNGLIFI